MTNPDDDIRERFQRLRGELENEGAPDFRAMLAKAKADAAAGPVPLHAPRRWHRHVGWAGAAMAAAVAGLLLTSDNGTDPADAEFERLVASFASDQAAGAWQSPTARLLDVPGSDLMRSVPSVGADVPGLGFPELPDFDRVGDTL